MKKCKTSEGVAFVAIAETGKKWSIYDADRRPIGYITKSGPTGYWANAPFFLSVKTTRRAAIEALQRLAA